MRKVSAPVALAVSLLLPNLALAQVPPPPSGSAPAAQPAPAPAPAAAPAPAELTEDQKLERAKGLYMEAEGAFEAGDYVTATQKYEEAYYLVPGKHGFAFKVGVAAWNAGDCVKADEYLRHFTTYAEGEKHAEKLEEAKKIMGEIAIQGCAQQAAPAPEPAPVTSDPTDSGDDAPMLTSRSSEREAAAAKSREDAAKNRKGGLFIGGVVLLSVGAAAAAGGVTTLIIAKNNADALADASSNATATGFPTGDYSTSEIYQKDQRLGTLNILSPILLGVGGAAIAGGVVMIILDKKKRGGGGQNAKAKGAELTAVGPTVLPGGGGAAASFKF